MKVRYFKLDILKDTQSTKGLKKFLLMVVLLIGILQKIYRRRVKKNMIYLTNTTCFYIFSEIWLKIINVMYLLIPYLFWLLLILWLSWRQPHVTFIALNEDWLAKVNIKLLDSENSVKV